MKKCHQNISKLFSMKSEIKEEAPDNFLCEPRPGWKSSQARDTSKVACEIDNQQEIAKDENKEDEDWTADVNLPEGWSTGGPCH